MTTIDPFPRTDALLRRRFVAFFFPTLLAAAAMQLTFIAAGVFVGNLLGPDCFAAMNLALPLIQIYVSAGAFFGVGGAVLVALCKGAHKDHEASEIFCLSFWGMILSGLVVMCAGFYWKTTFVTFLTGNNAELAQSLTAYLVPGFLGAPVFVLVAGIVYFIRADGHPNLASALMIVANLLYLALTPVFIIITGDLSGPAWAMTIGYALAAFGVYFYFASKRRTLRMIWPGNFLRNTVALIMNGFPVAAQGLQVPFRILCVNGLVVTYGGTLGLTAHSIVLACILLMSMCISGVVQTMMPMVGILYGDKDRQGVRFIFGYSFGILGVSSFLLCGFTWLFPQTVLRIYGITDPEMLAVGTTALRLFAPAIPGVALVGLLRSYSQAIGHPMTAMMIVLVENILVMLPALWLFSYWFGLHGVWWSFVIAEYAALIPYAILVAFVIHKGNREGWLLLPKSDLVWEATMTRQAAANTASIIDAVQNEQLAQQVTETLASIFNAKASTVDLRIRCSGNETIVQVRYDGPPFNPFDGDETTEHSWILGLNDLRRKISLPASGTQG